jgi:hypothetical protein
VCCQVEHGVESLKVGLKEWQFNIKIIGFGMFELGNIFINSKS